MSSRYPFSIIRFEPSETRSERVNVGVVIFKPTGVDIRLDPSYSRQVIIREYSASEELIRLEGTLKFWAETGYSDGDWEEAYRALRLSSRWSLSPLGCFFADSDSQYELEVRGLLDDLVTPVGSSRTASSKPRLMMELREEFNRIGILGESERDFENGYIVPRYPITLGKRVLRVDFALGGKEVYLLQTVDLSVADASEKVREASLKAVIVDQARSLFSKVHAVFVVRWSVMDSDSQDTCKEIVKAYSDGILDFDNERQRIELLARLSRLKGRSGDLFRSARSTVSASEPRLLKAN